MGRSKNISSIQNLCGQHLTVQLVSFAWPMSLHSSCGCGRFGVAIGPLGLRVPLNSGSRYSCTHPTRSGGLSDFWICRHLCRTMVKQHCGLEALLGRQEIVQEQPPVVDPCMHALAFDRP